MSDDYLIEYCSPTLASIKCASMFSCRIKDEYELGQWVLSHNRRFAENGLGMITLYIRNGRALIFLFRFSALRSLLEKQDVKDFLSRYGYPMEKGCLFACLQHLKQRFLPGHPFPDEIGIFLGYPLDDVEGFVHNRGKNFKAAGLWKVYGDVERSMDSFRKMKRCRTEYSRRWKEGKEDIYEMAVTG